MCRDVDAVRAIIATNPDVVNESDEHGDTPLVIASRWQLWVYAGPYPGEDREDYCSGGAEDVADDDWMQQVHDAESSKLREICVLLIDAGADTTGLFDWLNNDPLGLGDVPDDPLESWDSNYQSPYEVFGDSNDVLESDSCTLEDLRQLCEHSKHRSPARKGDAEISNPE